MQIAYMPDAGRKRAPSPAPGEGLARTGWIPRLRRRECPGM